MKRFVFIISILVCFVAKQKAQNLIRNGSFENYHTPINWNLWGGDFIGYYTWPPDTVMIDWKDYQTADFFISACTHTYSGVPTNFFGYSNAKDGNGYVGLVAYAKGGYDKEYLYQKLTQPLQAGNVYCLSFYVNRADRVTYAIKNIGALFSNNLQPLTNGYEINAIPQVENQTGIISDTVNWTLIQGCFTAIGGEQYITIGNFTTNFNTDTLNTNSTNLAPGRETTSYYYIDDVTLIDQSTVGSNELNNERSIEIYPNPTTSIFYIRDKNHQLQNASVEIKNTLGQVVYVGIYSNQIDVSNLPQGIYFITINKKESKQTIKFVKD
jgi:hypothetical protein